MAQTTRTQIPAEVNNFYDRTVLDRALPVMPHALFGQRRALPKGAGSNVIKFRRYGSLTAATTALTEGTAPTGSQASVTDITATALQYGDFVSFSDIVSDQSIDPVLTEMSQVLGEQMGDTNDQLARNILAAGTTIQYAAGRVSRVTVASTDKLVIDEFDKALRTLGNAKAKRITEFGGVSTGVGTVPVRDCYVAIISEYAAYDVRKITEFQSVETYAPNVGNLLPNEIGKIRNVRIIATTNAKVFTGAGASGIDVHACLILGANAYGVVDLGNSQASAGVIYKPLGSAGTADPLNQNQTLGWKEYFVTKILNDAYMVRIEHAVS